MITISTLNQSVVPCVLIVMCIIGLFPMTLQNLIDKIHEFYGID